MPPIPKVALLLETSREYGRQLLRGIMRYARLHGPWSFVVSPGHFEQQLPGVQRRRRPGAVIGMLLVAVLIVEVPKYAFLSLG